MPTEADVDTRALCDCLRRYLDSHPDAADSLSGIRQWWLPAPFDQVALDELRRALAQLVASGEVQCSTLPDKSELYTRGSTTEARRPWQKS